MRPNLKEKYLVLWYRVSQAWSDFWDRRRFRRKKNRERYERRLSRDNRRVYGVNAKGERVAGFEYPNPFYDSRKENT